MASYNKFNVFVENLAEGVHDLGADTLKMMLSNSAPTATDAVKTDLTEISSGNGYTSGGATLAGVTSGQTSGVYTLDANDVTFTATGAIGPFRYAVIYNDTPTSPADPLIGWWDYGSSISLINGETFTVQFDAAGILTVT